MIIETHKSAYFFLPKVVTVINDCHAKCVILWLWPCSVFEVLKFVTVLRECCISRNIKKHAFCATLRTSFEITCTGYKGQCNSHSRISPNKMWLCPRTGWRNNEIWV